MGWRLPAARNFNGQFYCFNFSAYRAFVFRDNSRSFARNNGASFGRPDREKRGAAHFESAQTFGIFRLVSFAVYAFYNQKSGFVRLGEAGAV